ncbi:unnamed protein product [Cercospora beticola]|nr:unnamed protein product [Cercospora beticola]
MLQQISAPAVDPYVRLVVHFRVLRSTAARKRLAAAAHGQDVALDDLAGFRFEINLGWQLSPAAFPREEAYHARWRLRNVQLIAGFISNSKITVAQADRCAADDT